jgi:hypothetical protein
MVLASWCADRLTWATQHCGAPVSVGHHELLELAAALPRAKDERGVKLWDGSRVSDAAWDLHEAFKAELIATMPREGGILPGIVIEAWVTAKQHAQDTDDLPGS